MPYMFWKSLGMNGKACSLMKLYLAKLWYIMILEMVFSSKYWKNDKCLENTEKKYLNIIIKNLR